MKRAFLSHRIDFLSPAEAKANHDKYQALLAALGIEVTSAAETLAGEIGSSDAVARTDAATERREPPTSRHIWSGSSQ